jgi:N-acylneuraminate cytidylyltransferase
MATPLGLTGFIFARGGSKGVPRKNLRMVGGKPLIAWAIDCALSSRHIDRIVVSTDDAEIAEASRAHGAETPFSRPAELASDSASELLAWRHAIEAMRALEDGAALDPFVSVPAVAPLRAPQDVDASIEEFVRLRAADASPDLVLSVTPAQRSPYFNMVVDGADGWVRLAARGEGGAPVRRQDAPQMFDIATCVYTADPAFILRADALLDGRVGRIVVPQERALDIDTEFDLEIADLLLSRRRQGGRPS